MALFDSFRRPKWRHSDPEKRAEAVRRLDPGDVEILQKVACEDEELSVRRLAIKKLRDPDVLSALASSVGDEGLKQMAVEKADAIRAVIASSGDGAGRADALAKITTASAFVSVAKEAADEAVRSAALARLEDPRSFADVARKASAATTRLAALERVTTVSVLRAIGLNDEAEEVAVRAVELLKDPEALAAIAKKSKRRGARQKASAKLELSDYRPAPNKRRRGEQLELVAMVERLASSHEWEATATKLEQARQSWQTLGQDADEKLRLRFDASYEEFFVRRARYQKERSEQATAGVDKAADAAVAATAGTAGEDEVASEAGEARETRKPRESREARETESPLVRLLKQAEKIAHGKDLARAKSRIEGLTGEWKRLTANDPVDAALSQRWELAQEQILERQGEAKEQDEKRRADNLKRIEALIERGERILSTDQLKRVSSTLKELHSAERKPGPLPPSTDRKKLREQIEPIVEKLTIRVGELREGEEWKRWANEPIREKICEQVEALIEDKDLVSVSKKMRELQTEWSEAGPVSREKFAVLRQRFHDAAKKVRAKTDEHFRGLSVQRKDNLDKKLALCETAESLSASTDWKRTADELKRLQAEWKKLGPVPRAKADAVWKRFRRACDQFFDKRSEQFEARDEELVRNLAEKEAMCDRVEDLALSTDWEETASRLKRMQSEWRRIGPVRRADGDVVWKRFRKACDTFFERFARRDEVERELELEDVSDLIEEVEGLLAEPSAEALDDPASPAAADDDAIAASARQLWGMRNRLEIGHPAERKMLDRLSKAVGAVLASKGDLFSGTELDIETNVAKRSALCDRVDQLTDRIDHSGSDEASADVRKMAEKLRRALAENALRDGDAASRTRDELKAELERLAQEFAQSPPVPAERGKELTERFATARRAFLKGLGPTARKSD